MPGGPVQAAITGASGPRRGSVDQRVPTSFASSVTLAHSVSPASIAASNRWTSRASPSVRSDQRVEDLVELLVVEPSTAKRLREAQEDRHRGAELMTDPADQLLPACPALEQRFLRDLQLPRPPSVRVREPRCSCSITVGVTSGEMSAAPARGTPDRVDDLVALGILEHVARRSRNQHLAHGALLFEPGERDDLERGVQGLQPARGLDPVHLWHADVHQDDVGSQLVDELDRLDAVRRLADDLEVLAAEEGSERTPEAVVVVDHEDANATGQGKGALRHVQRVRRAKGSRYPTVVGFLRGTRVWAGWPRPSSRRATGDSPPAWSDGAEPAAILGADVPATTGSNR